MNGVEPEAYLRDIIGRIADHPIKRIDELLPWCWSQGAKAEESLHDQGRPKT